MTEYDSNKIIKSEDLKTAKYPSRLTNGWI